MKIWPIQNDAKFVEKLLYQSKWHFIVVHWLLLFKPHLYTHINNPWQIVGPTIPRTISNKTLVYRPHDAWP
jgi:hypothetical protein